jgi:miniconductance mechanosensitive channel
MEPTSQGLPIQVYTFCTDQRWVYYEAIQSDIFDHILAVIPEFELRVYQRPAGADFNSPFYVANKES